MGDVDTFVSALALIVSIAVGVSQYHMSKKINAWGVNFELSKELFWDQLKDGIPSARKYMYYDSSQHRILHTDKLESEMVRLIKNAKYFNYADLKFYNNLCVRARRVEDHLVVISGQEISRIAFLEFESDLDENLKTIYKIILKKFNP